MPDLSLDTEQRGSTSLLQPGYASSVNLRDMISCAVCMHVTSVWLCKEVCVKPDGSVTRYLTSCKLCLVLAVHTWLLLLSCMKVAVKRHLGWVNFPASSAQWHSICFNPLGSSFPSRNTSNTNPDLSPVIPSPNGSAALISGLLRFGTEGAQIKDLLSI